MMKLHLVVLSLVFLFISHTHSLSDHAFNKKTTHEKILCNKISGNLKKVSSSKGIPKKIKIEITDSGGWYRNFFRAIRSVGKMKYNNLIDKNTKSYFPGKLIVEYKNEIECVYPARIKIHGGHADHLSESEFISSMRVRLMEGEILNRKYFTLFLPKSRNNDNEIFMSTFLENLGFLSPLTFKTKVKVNLNAEYSTFLFQERFDWHFLRENSRRPGPILSGNKSFQIREKSKLNENIILGLTRVEDQIIQDRSESLKALDLANFYYLQNLSFKKIPKNNFDKTNLFIDEFIPQNFLYFDSNLSKSKNKNLRKIAMFDSLLIASGGIHSLELNDRKFYYDLIFDRLEPIYYDGMIKILEQKYEPKINFVFDHYKYGARLAKNNLENLNIEKLLLDLEKRGVSINNKKITEILNNIENNLDIIIDAKNFQFDNNVDEEYFFNYKENDINFKLAFNGYENNFTICKAYLLDCYNIKTDDEKASNLIKEQVYEINDENVLYVRNDLKKYENNRKPKNSGLNSMKEIEIEKNSKIHFTEDALIKVDKIKKIIEIEMSSQNARTIIIAKDLKDWKFNLNGKSKNYNDKTISKKINDPEGCLTFVDSKIENISIYTKNTTCHASIQFLRTIGSIKEINILNAQYEAFDADFSNLLVNKIFIDGSGDDCIGTKMGKYNFTDVKLKNCKDKAVSAGAWSNVSLKNVNISNSQFGLVSKRSSILRADNTKILETHRCVVAYAEEFGGSKIITTKNLYTCSNNSFFVDNKSIWEKI